MRFSPRENGDTPRFLANDHIVRDFAAEFVLAVPGIEQRIRGQVRVARA